MKYCRKRNHLNNYLLPETSGGESSGDGGVDGGVVLVQVSVLQQHQVVLLHDLRAIYVEDEFNRSGVLGM